MHTKTDSLNNPRAIHAGRIRQLGFDGINSALLNWLALIWPFIRLYLMGTLNLRPEESSELEKVVIFYPGELHVTASHVDLVMDLETISMRIRMAGLDRNPGWLADFGRVIAYHFN